MESHKFKLGDKVIVQIGPHRDREGHVIGITCDESGPDMIAVRLYAEPTQTAIVTSNDLHSAQ